jgi:outer membrane biogenesis lipoprotein LolB
MSKKYFAYIIFISLLVQSCSILNPISSKVKEILPTKRARGKIISPNVQTDKTSTAETSDNRVRVITINKITGDTLVEWLQPIEANQTANKILPVKDLSQSDMNQNTSVVGSKEQAYKFIMVEYVANTAPVVSLKNDTLYITMDSLQSNELLKSVASLQIKTGIADNIKPSKTARVLKNTIKKENQKITKSAELPTRDLENMSDVKPIINLDLGDALYNFDSLSPLITNVKLINEVISHNTFKWQSYKSKVRVKVKSDADNKTFNINLRQQQDSVVWASISVLGIEFVRAKIIKNKMMLLDYSKDKYYEYNATQIDDVLGMPIEFNNLQNFIIGMPPIMQSEIMYAKQNQKGTAVKLIDDNTNAFYTFNTDSTLQSMVIITKKDNKTFSLQGQFNEYVESGNGKLSLNRNFILSNNGKISSIEININKFEFDPLNMEFPYQVPEKFKMGGK